MILAQTVTTHHITTIMGVYNKQVRGCKVKLKSVYELQIKLLSRFYSYQLRQQEDLTFIKLFISTFLFSYTSRSTF